MSRNESKLHRIEIASPCTQDWGAMTGDDKRRFCGACRLHVHDLSQMTRHEVDVLLEGADGRLCVRFYRRPDGRILTRDCVTVRERLQRRVRRLRVAAAALFALVAPFVGGCGAATDAGGTGNGLGGVVPEDPVRPPEMGEPTMGDICIPEEERPATPSEDGAEAPAEETGDAGHAADQPLMGKVRAVNDGFETGRMVIRPEDYVDER